MAESSVASSGTKKKKKRSVFKSLGRGLSRKKKKQRPDDESVMSVSLQNAAAASAPPTPVPARTEPKAVAFANDARPIPPSTVGGTKPLQVILLLMDPSSQRFELLQLDFDPNKALVSDILRQIKRSAKETTLRDMNYVGVSDQTGMEMISHMKLSRFCQGNDIVLAIPSGLSAKDTAKLAEPILSDPKVEEMLVPVGAKILKPAKRRKSKLTKISEVGTSSSANGESGGKSKGVKSASSLPTKVLGVAISSLAFFVAQRHLSVTKPLQSGDVLSMGEWKSQCGIFDLLPHSSLTDKLASACDVSSSSMLELGKDGILRYFTKDEGGERKEVWIVEGDFSGGDQCEEEDEEECAQCGCDGEDEATFVKEGNSWFVEMGGTRNILITDVIRDFMSES